MKVLIVDDDPDDLEMMGLCVREMLPDCEAVTLVKQPYTTGIDPAVYDLLVIDECLKGVSGTELAKAFRTQGFSGTIAVITGTDSPPHYYDIWLRKSEQFSELRALLRAMRNG